MSVLPRTQLGYTLGLRRDKNIYGQGERAQKNPFVSLIPHTCSPNSLFLEGKVNILAGIKTPGNCWNVKNNL